MVFTNNQTTAFFTQATQMAIPQRTVDQLLTEGIATVDDLGEFTDDMFKQVVSNLRSPPQIPDPAAPANLINQAPFVLGAKSLKRLKTAAQAVRYYQSINRDLTPGNMHYENTLKHFAPQWKSLVDRKEEDKPDVPKISKNLKVTRWTEAFDDFLHRVIGVRNAPLAYVIRKEPAVAIPAPALLPQRPYCEEHGSVEGELIARLSHDSPLYRDDNKEVYHFLEEATRSTTYSSTLKPFQTRKNGRAAHQAMLSQHAGEDKWEKELKAQEGLLKTRVWKGNTNFSLEKFVDQHRTAYILLQQCKEHVDYELPNERTRVTYLMDAIHCADAELQAALAAIRQDKGANGMRSDFEQAAAFLLPADPVARKRKSGSGGQMADIGATATVGSTNLKPGIGESGVELRYHTDKEYPHLNQEQKKELREWRKRQRAAGKDTGGKGSQKGDDADGGDVAGLSRKKMRRMVASLMQESKKKESQQQANDAAAIESLREIFAVSITPGQKGTTAAPAAPTVAVANAQSSATVSDISTSQMVQKLNGILKRHKKPSST